MKSFLSILFLFLSVLASAQEITGDWNGMLNAPGAKLRLVIHITKTADGYAATMDSPDQRATGIPVSQVSFENNVLKFGITAMGVQYEGKLGEDKRITGIFKQGGLTVPMELSKDLLGKPALVRPQEPAKPYPYYSEEVKFANTSAGISLAGTLTLPKQEGNFPAVVLISGSGVQNRDGEIFGHKPFLVLADHQTRQGIAVLRFDDRGTYASGGDFRTATTQDFASDIEAAVAYLMSRKEINKKHIGLIGHSEGGIVAPIVAAKQKDVSYIVLLAGTAIPGDQLLIAQRDLIARASGMSEADILPGKNLHRDMMELVKNAKDSASLVTTATAYFQKGLKDNPALQKPANQTEDQFIKSQIAQLSNRWIMNFIKYDPSIVLEKVRCPVLALNGSKDLQVPPAINLTAIRKGLEKGGNKSVTTKEIPGLNHLFQECKTGLPNEYGEIEQTFSPVALSEISAWVSKQLK